MSPFKKIIASLEIERAYNRFMLDFEIQALRLTCVFGIATACMFLLLDYWRVDDFIDVLIYRSAVLFTLAFVIFLTYQRKPTPSYHDFLCLILSSALPVLFYLLDLNAGMPEFYMPNTICFLLYALNAGLGHAQRLKIVYTVSFVGSFVLYSIYLSPHKSLHVSQILNVFTNASLSLLIGFLVAWFKRLSFIQQGQLIESNSKLDLALRSVELGVWNWDLKTDQGTLDQQTCQLLGLDYEKFDGSSEAFFAVMPPDDRKKVKELVAHALNTGKNSFAPEYRVVWPDGSLHYIKEKTKVIFDEDGVPAKLNGISWEVTDQRKIEQELKEQQDALKESESKFRQISETINDVFYLYSISEKRYEFISTNCQKVLGAPQEFFYNGGEYSKSIVLKEDQQKMYDAYRRVEEGTPYEEEFRIIIDGELKWIREKAFPIKDDSGRVVKKSGICTDITHFKFQELQLMAQKQNLENLNRTKDKFFSIVAHDLKSPLISLKAFIDLLIHRTERFNKEEIIKTSRHALTSVENTIKMTDNLITWARLQMNEFKSQPEEIYFKDVVTTILPVYKSVAEKKGITLTWTFDDNLTVYGDKNQIEFIIRNLLNNAVKFTHRSGHVALDAHSLDDLLIHISVTDNGMGISPERQKKIFSMGSSQPIKGTAGELGTGLGLMLCYEFAKLNDGTLKVESEEGKGSTFYLKLRQTEPTD